MQFTKPILILLAVIAFVLSPILSPGFSGFTADQFPVPQTDPLIQPMGLTFAVIWTVIYAWLLVMALYGLFKRPLHPDWDAHRWPLLASLVIGAAWIPVANISPIVATVMIWAMMLTALWALMRLPYHDRLWLQAPVGLYAGWLTAASCVGTAVVFTGYGGTPVFLIHAGFLLLAAGIAVLIYRMSLRSLPFYLGAMVWAVLGIVIDNFAVGRIGFGVLALLVMLVLLPLEFRAIKTYREAL